MWNFVRPFTRSSNICSRDFPRSSATRYRICPCPTSSCTFAVSESLRFNVGARGIHSRSGSAPMTSEFACISMNFIAARRYSSGIHSPASIFSPASIRALNAATRSS